MGLIFDIGASDGADTTVYLESGHKVVAVEANPDLCEQMQLRFAAEIASGHLALANRAISRRRKAVFYVNSEEPGWGTMLPAYAERGAKLRGQVKRIEVDTTTVIDLIRQFGAPDYLKVGLCHVNLNWPREVSTTQFEFMRLSQLATSGKLLLGRRGACGGM